MPRNYYWFFALTVFHLEKRVHISFYEFIISPDKVKLLSHIWLFATPWTVACTRFLSPWDFLGKNTGVGCHFLLHEHCFKVRPLLASDGIWQPYSFNPTMVMSPEWDSEAWGEANCRGQTSPPTKTSQKPRRLSVAGIFYHLG